MRFGAAFLVILLALPLYAYSVPRLWSTRNDCRRCFGSGAVWMDLIDTDFWYVFQKVSCSACNGEGTLSSP